MTDRVLNVRASTHGRVLVRDAREGSGLLVGFHGYMENAETQMERLAAIPGAESWTLVSIQGLHRFYRGRSNDVVASWMTRQDRELAIDDNVEYVTQALTAIEAGDRPIVCIGFSQGGQMAFRAALRSTPRATGIVSVGSDLPPELLADARSWFPRVLLARGIHDEWYTAEKLRKDYAALRPRVDALEKMEYEGGHEWTPAVAAAAGKFLASGHQP